jgi:t-SNARE complex subunit (syntaxin)
MGNRSANDSKSSALNKIVKERNMFLHFVKGERASLPAEESARATRWTEAIFLIICCFVACVIVAVIWKFITAKN